MKTAARPYAEALFALAQAEGRASEVLAEVQGLAAGLRQVSGARELLAHPGVNPAAAGALVGGLCEGASPLVSRFVRVLADKRRLALLEEIARELSSRLDEAEGRVRAVLQTARPVDQAASAAVAESLGRQLGRKVDIRSEVRPDLIGGARVLVGDRVLDGTVAGQLTRLRRRLRSGQA